MSKNGCVLELYLVGQASKSVESINNIKTVFENNFKGQYSLDTIELIENPKINKCDKVLATPTSIRYISGPVSKTIGNLNKNEKVTSVRLKINKILQ